MTPAQLFLDGSRRQIVRLITIGLSGLALVFSVIVIAMMVLAPRSGLIIFLVVLVTFFCSCCLTLATIGRWPLRQTMVPVTVGLFMIITVVGILIPDLAQVAAPFLAFNVLLVSLSGNRRLTLLIACVSAVIALAIVSHFPRPFATLDLGETVVAFVTILAAGTFVVVIWLVSSRFIESQDTALALAEQRAHEAEVARAHSETARATLAQQSAEQERLLDLVRTLELPVLPVGTGLLVVPLVGSLDMQRITAIQDAILRKVTDLRANTVVMDVTGVHQPDTATVQSLLRIAQAVRLLGAQTMISGMRPEVAQILAGLSVDLAGVQSVGDVGQAIDLARQRISWGDR
jgi:rsbT co-antagonist protein RsbR